MKSPEKITLLPKRLSEERVYFILLLVLWALSSLFAIRQLLYVYHNFRGVACDTAVVQNVIVNILHGNWFRETAYGGPNALGIHSHFIFLLMAPIYALWPSADTLSILQILGAQSLVFPLYAIGKEVLKQPFTAFLVALSGLLNPMLANLACVPLHPELFILPAVFWSYYFYLRDRPRCFWLCLIFAVCCGEHAAIIYVALGVALLFGEKRLAWGRRYGWFALAGGVCWLLFTMCVITPLFHSPGQYDNFASKYSDIGVSTPYQLVKRVVTDPGVLASKILDWKHWERSLGTIGFSLLFVFVSWESALLLLPLPLFWLMNNNELYLLIHAYYFQFLFFAACIGVLTFARRWGISTRIGRIALILLVVSNGLFLTYEQWVLSKRHHAGGEEDINTAIRQEFTNIPVEAGVYAPHRFSAYLSNRVDMVMGDLKDEHLDFESMVNARVNETTVRAEQIDYIVVDLISDQCGLRLTMANQEQSQRRHDNIQHLLDTGRWELFWNEHDVVILRRVGK